MESSEFDKDHPRATEPLVTQEDENDRTTLERVEFAAGHLKNVISVFTSVLILVIVIGLVVSITRQVLENTVLIEPIQVPQSLVERGYTPEVVAHRLMDEVIAIRDEITSFKEGRVLAADWTRADIQVPGAGISIKTYLSYLRTLIGVPQTRIGGEITRDGDMLSLRLRLRSPQGSHPNPLAQSATNLDDLLRAGAQDMVKSVDPYLLAFYFASRDATVARQLINYCLKNEPTDDDYWAYNLEGTLYLRESDFDDAEKMFQKALELKPDFEVAVMNLGLMNAVREDYEQAEEYFEKAIQLNPNVGLVHALKGLSFALRGDEKNTHVNYEKAVEIDPGDARIYLSWFVAHDLLGQKEEAIEKSKMALTMKPNYIEAHYLLGEFYSRDNKYTDALPHIFEVARQSRYYTLRMRSSLSYALHQYANTVVKAGDYDAAIGMYEQALEIIPDSYASQNFERRLQQLQAQKSNEAEKEPG